MSQTQTDATKVKVLYLRHTSTDFRTRYRVMLSVMTSLVSRDDLLVQVVTLDNQLQPEDPIGTPDQFDYVFFDPHHLAG